VNGHVKTNVRAMKIVPAKGTGHGREIGLATASEPVIRVKAIASVPDVPMATVRKVVPAMAAHEGIVRMATVPKARPRVARKPVSVGIVPMGLRRKRASSVARGSLNLPSLARSRGIAGHMQARPLRIVRRVWQLAAPNALTAPGRNLEPKDPIARGFPALRLMARAPSIAPPVRNAGPTTASPLAISALRNRPIARRAISVRKVLRIRATFKRLRPVLAAMGRRLIVLTNHAAIPARVRLPRTTAT
jgi:hypothetical protein